MIVLSNINRTTRICQCITRRWQRFWNQCVNPKSGQNSY